MLVTVRSVRPASNCSKSTSRIAVRTANLWRREPKTAQMNVTILGSGVIGVTTAYYLAKAGHEVTVLDRREGPALETSFANAGEVSFGYCSPWAAPGIPLKALKWLFMEHAPLILRPKCDFAM